MTEKASNHPQPTVIFAGRLGLQSLGNKEKTMLLPHGTVIALVDGKNFVLYRNAGNEA